MDCDIHPDDWGWVTMMEAMMTSSAVFSSFCMGVIAVVLLIWGGRHG